MLSREFLFEFEKGLNPQKPAESKIPARIVGYGEISAIFEIEADKNHVYKRLPLFDSLAAARHYQQMYLDRFFTTRLLWKRYEFILPGKIKR
jgi:hypothetical protein